MAETAKRARVKMGLGFPSGIEPEVLIRMVRHADEQGVEFLCPHDHLGPYMRDVFVFMTLMVANTDRAIVGPNIVNPYTRHPVNVCRAIAHLDEIAPGRVFVNWAPGDYLTGGIDSLGLEWQSPLGVTREAVELSKLILSGHIPPELDPPIPDQYKIQYKGKHFQFTENYVMPSRKVPVMVSSGAPKMLQMAGELCDEVMIGHYTDPEGIAWALENVEIGAQRSGRTLDDIPLHLGIHLSVWPDRQEAYDAVAKAAIANLLYSDKYRHQFGIKMPFEETIGDWTDPESNAHKMWFGRVTYLMTPDLIKEIPQETQLRFSAAGTPDDVIEQLRRTLDPRIDVLHVIPHPPQPWQENWETMLRLLTSEVLPALS